MASGDRIKIIGGIDWREYTQKYSSISAKNSSENTYKTAFEISGEGAITKATIHKTLGDGFNTATFRIIVDGDTIFQSAIDSSPNKRTSGIKVNTDVNIDLPHITSDENKGVFNIFQPVFFYNELKIEVKSTTGTATSDFNIGFLLK